jgi:hypothetical protein
MTTDELIKFVQDELDKGLNDVAIVKAAVNAGATQDDAEAVLRRINDRAGHLAWGPGDFEILSGEED